VICPGLANERKILKSTGGKSFPRKFEKWREKNHDLLARLVISAFFPVSTDRLENYVADIKIEEFPDNFRVVSVMPKHISHLTVPAQSSFKNHKVSLKEEGIICVVFFQVYAMNKNTVGSMCSFYEDKDTPLKQLALECWTNQKKILEELNGRLDITAGRIKE
jgi:hypothetical protein